MFIGFKYLKSVFSYLHDFFFSNHNDSCYRCVRMDGKGFGVVARRDIKVGDIILQERPILSWKNYASLKSQFNKLSDSEKKDVMNLSNSYFELSDKLEGIANTNAFFWESTESLCLFLRSSRFNHSCIPNIQTVYRSSELSIYASCDISKDEELCLSYLPLWQSPYTLKHELRKKYRFDCCCELCSMKNQVEKKKIMRYRRRYGSIVSFLSQRYNNGEKVELHSIMQIFETLKKAKLWFPHLTLAHSVDGFEIAMSQKMPKKARKFIEMAYHANIIIFGKHCDSNKPFQELIGFLDVEESRNERKTLYSRRNCKLFFE